MCFYLLVSIFYKVWNRKYKSPQNPHFHPISGTVRNMVAAFHTLHGNGIHLVLIDLENMCIFFNANKSNVFMVILIEIIFSIVILK